jgi:hypothetical protein
MILVMLRLTTNRWLALGMALWFGGLYCFFGCEMGGPAAAMPTAHQAGHHGTKNDAAMDKECPDGCCQKPADSEPSQHSHPDHEMTCCRAMATANVQKAQPIKHGPAADQGLSAHPEPVRRNPAVAVGSARLLDLHEVYLLLRVLRI